MHFRLCFTKNKQKVINCLQYRYRGTTTLPFLIGNCNLRSPSHCAWTVLRPYLLDMLLLRPNRPCHFRICKKKWVWQYILCTCAVNPLAVSHSLLILSTCQNTLLSGKTTAWAVWQSVLAKQSAFSSKPWMIVSKVGVVNEVNFYFFPNQPTLISFCQCPSNNTSNRYGLGWSRVLVSKFT